MSSLVGDWFTKTVSCPETSSLEETTANGFFIGKLLYENGLITNESYNGLRNDNDPVGIMHCSPESLQVASLG